MSGWFTDENGELHRFAGGSGFKSALPVGAIFASAIPLTDSSVHALDGSTISQTGMYEQFANLIKSLVSAGFKITCTQEEFDTSVSTYGQCGKFVINNTSGTIRLPLITEFIASNNGGQEIGLAELDSFKQHTHYSVDAYSGGGTQASRYALESISSTKTGWGNLVGSSPTGDTETKPKNIRYPYYIVLLNGFDETASGGSGGTSVSSKGFEFVGSYSSSTINVSVDIDLDNYNYLAIIAVYATAETNLGLFPNIPFTVTYASGNISNFNYCYIDYHKCMSSAVYINHSSNTTFVYPLKGDAITLCSSTSKPTSLTTYTTGISSGASIILYRSKK